MVKIVKLFFCVLTKNDFNFPFPNILTVSFGLIAHLFNREKTKNKRGHN